MVWVVLPPQEPGGTLLARSRVVFLINNNNNNNNILCCQRGVFTRVFTSEPFQRRASLFTQSGRCNTADDLQVFSVLHTGPLVRGSADWTWLALRQMKWILVREFCGFAVCWSLGAAEGKVYKSWIKASVSHPLPPLASLQARADGFTSQQLVRLQMAAASPPPASPCLPLLKPADGRRHMCVCRGAGGQSWTLTHCLVMSVTLSVAARSVCCC